MDQVSEAQGPRTSSNMTIPYFCGFVHVCRYKTAETTVSHSRLIQSLLTHEIQKCSPMVVKVIENSKTGKMKENTNVEK